jgi:2,3-bisphosphoglycerate-dependent phosphoglycerate mutase
MSVEVVILRHADADVRPDVDEMSWELSPMGQRQAEALVQRLRGLKITKIVSSDAVRTLATVEPFASAEGLRVATDPELRERDLCGGWRDDFDELMQRSWEDFDWKFEGHESLREAQYRFIRALKAHMARQGRGKLLIVSHGQVIGTFLQFLGRDMTYRQWKDMRMPELYRVAL